MLKIGLVRHAATQWNLEKKIQGRTDIPLCTEGMLQAERWGNILKGQHYDLILSSPMIRAQQTAQIVSDVLGIDVVCARDLREQDFGQWEGRRITDIRKETPGEIEFQESRGWEFCPPGGEDRVTVLRRASDAIKKASQAHDGRHILLVTHSSVIKILIYKAQGRSFLPEEGPVSKGGWLHTLVWNKMLLIEALNQVRLV
jgi:probable phosphoglycerate mutase